MTNKDRFEELLDEIEQNTNLNWKLYEPYKEELRSIYRELKKENQRLSAGIELMGNEVQRLNNLCNVCNLKSENEKLKEARKSKFIVPKWAYKDIKMEDEF